MFKNDQPQVHPSTYVRIAQLQSSALFPSLRHLYYDLDDRSISHIFLFQSPLLDSFELINIRGFENAIVGPFLATISPQMLTRIVLRSGRMTVDILKRYIVHFKQLRSLELSDAVSTNNFVLWEIVGTLPFLANFTLKAIDPESHPAHAPEKSNSQGGGPKYFDALESLCVTGSFFLIQHLLGFIDSPYLKSIEVNPLIDHFHNDSEYEHMHEPEDLFTPSMTIVTSKWSQSVKNLVIGSSSSVRYPISKCLKMLTVLHEMQTFQLKCWKMENTDDDVRCLVMSWPKLGTLKLPLNQTFIPLSTLRIIAEKCPELRLLHIRLNNSTATLPFDTSSNSLHHNLEVLIVGRGHSSTSITKTMLESQIQVAQYLDSIFPHLKSLQARPNLKNVTCQWSTIHNLLKLCQNARQVK